MDQHSFSSDSTYYSGYENFARSSKNGRNHSSQSSRILDHIHKEVRLHLEGVKLLGNHEVTKYMKEISRMKLSPANATSAKKIQSSLLKIHKCNEFFQKSVVCSGKFSKIIPDPVVHCEVTQDLNMLDSNNKKNVQPVILGLCGNSNESYSFGSDMLTNKNFITECSRQSIRSINKTLLNNCEMKLCETGNFEINGQNVNPNSMDLFLSQEDEFMEEPSLFLEEKKPSNGFQISVSSNKLDNNSENSWSNQPRIISNKASPQTADSSMMKADLKSPSSSQDTEIYLESFNSSSNDTMFKIPILKNKGKYNKHKKNCYYDKTAIHGAVRYNDEQVHENQDVEKMKKINEILKGTFCINEQNQLNKTEKFFEECSIRYEETSENSITCDTDTIASCEDVQSSQSISSDMPKDSKRTHSQNESCVVPHKNTVLSDIQHTSSVLEVAAENKKYADSNTNIIQTIVTDNSRDEFGMMVAKILNMNDQYFQKVNFPTNIIPESIHTRMKQTPKANFDTVNTVSSSFLEIYTKKIQRINSDVTNGSKTWGEINDELEYTIKLSRSTSDALSEMFEKVSIDERNTIENAHLRKLEDAGFHEFDEEDTRELDMKSLLLSNEKILKQLSTHFKKLLSEKKNGSWDNSCRYNIEEHTSIIDWKTLVKIENQ